MSYHDNTDADELSGDPTNHEMFKFIAQEHESLLKLAYGDSHAVLQEHHPLTLFGPLSTPVKLDTVLTEALVLSDDSVFAGPADVNPLMTAPIIELPASPVMMDRIASPQYANGRPAITPSPHPHIAEEQEQSMPALKPKNGPRFREFQEDQWQSKFQELMKYKEEHGDCLVPHRYSENTSLGRWVKRQRYQYKLWQEGIPSTMTCERAQALASIGFIWDSQSAAWEEHLNDLKCFQALHGHCNVPSLSPEHAKLSTWIKCQRRQYKLYNEGQPSNMTQHRISELEKIGFQWDARASKKRKRETLLRLAQELENCSYEVDDLEPQPL